MVVKYVTQIPAADSNDRPGRRRQHREARAATRSAIVRPQAATTRSPACSCDTPSPTALTTPESSVPTTNGSGGRSW